MPRAGTPALSLLAVPINIHVLELLLEQSRPLEDLRREMGSPPVTTTRGYLRTLGETGIIVRQRQDDFPSCFDYELTTAGRELISVTKALRAWLALAPGGPVTIGSAAAKSAVKALVGAWGTNIVRALAARPLSLTQLANLITNVSYPSVERRLNSMRLAGQVEKLPGRGHARPYGITDWLRRAVAPLVAAARWEGRHLQARGAPITGRDVEAAFLLATPLAHLDPEFAGFCRLTVELRTASTSNLAGVVVELRDGRVIDCVTRLEGAPDGWVSGSPPAWFEAVMESDMARMELGGDPDLPRALVAGLSETLWSRHGSNHKVP